MLRKINYFFEFSSKEENVNVKYENIELQIKYLAIINKLKLWKLFII